MKRNYFFSIVFSLTFFPFVFSQILTESFNDDSGFTKSENFFTDGPDDYFGIFDPLGISDDFDGSPVTTGIPTYTGNTNTYLIGEDLDGNGGSATRTLTWSNIDISGYSNLTLSVDIAADTGAFDAADNITFEVNIDGSGYNSIIVFNGTGTNSDATNGSITLSTIFQNVNANITGTGNLLDLRLSITANADGEEFAIDEIILNGTPPVACSHSITSFSPIEGPEGTEVTIIGSGFTATSIAYFNGIAATTTQFVDNNTLIATVPNTAAGSISVIESSCTETSSNFTVTEFAGTCSSPFSDLIISEVYDSSSGSLGYIELYNGTGATIDLSEYKIDRYATLGGAVTFTYNFPAININDGDVLIGKVSNDSDVAGVTPDFIFTNTSGFNDDDRLELVFSSTNTVVDDWHDDSVTGAAGFSYLRNTNITGPNPNFDASEWVGNGTEDSSDLGNYSIVIIGNPTITSQPTVINGCLDVSISIMAAAGNGGTLTYQWKYNDGSTTNWLDVTTAAFAAATVTGETTNALFISGIDLNGYQFYCEVTEDATCSIASNAISTTSSTVTWDGTNWNWNDGTAQNTPPTLSDSVIINGNFDTAGSGLEDSFSACSLTVNAGFNLNVQNDTYIQIQNDIVANGDINVSTRGSVVQVNDLATVSGTGNILVTKETAIMNTANEYTYWSSPTANTTIANGLTDSNPSRRFKFNGANFLDATAETNNNGATVAGQDNIDDDANVWISVGGAEVMTPGVGYASTHNPNLFFFPTNYAYTFDGFFNNGIYNVPVYRNDSELNDNNWNFIGNPYPSAINAADFFNENAQELNVNGAIKGAIYLWSHVSQANANNNGNQVSNFAQSDYAILNYMGGTEGNTSQGVPNGYVASGQGFFVAMSDAVTADSTTGDIAQSNVVFNNSMRSTGNNDQFYRNSNTTVERYWLNLTTDNGAFSQILVGYTNNATSNFDGYIFDAPKNINNGVHTALFSNITGESRKFGIQGKSLSDLDIDEVVDLGYVTNINEATIYTISLIQFEGSFMTTNKIYIKDNLLNVIHNLKDSDYSFTSNTGEFNSRFEIVFQNTTLSTNDEVMQNAELKIIERNNGDLQFKVSRNFSITNVEILDILGRSLYNLDANSSSEIYDLQLNRANYIAKVTLSNGQVLSRKIVKQR